MNLVVWIIDKSIKPGRFGVAKAEKLSGLGKKPEKKKEKKEVAGK